MNHIIELLEEIAEGHKMSRLETAIQWGKIVLGIVALGALAYIIHLLQIIASK